MSCKPECKKQTQIDNDYRAVKEPHLVLKSDIDLWIYSDVTEDVTRAYFVIQKTKDKRWVNEARKHIFSDDFYIRINAALYLGMLRDEKSYPVLQEIVKSDRLRKETRDLAQSYIDRLSNQP